MSKVTSSTKFSIRKFDKKTSFTQWQRRMKDLLVQQSLMRPLLGKEEGQPDDMKDVEWAELEQRRKLYRLKLEENGNLMKHMNEFDGITDQLKKVDVKVEEEEKALLFLASLPDSYEVEDKDLSGLALVTKVRRKKSTGMGSKGGKSRSNNVQCFQCKGYAHIKRDCPTKRDESNENKSECAFVAKDDDCDVFAISKNIDANFD
ncbi:hypothetical protein QQP08_021690 [Theobroma cacao]|nr:hypothetical protein QQP08_021690 [Theobroma cacao]